MSDPRNDDDHHQEPDTYRYLGRVDDPDHQPADGEFTPDPLNDDAEPGTCGWYGGHKNHDIEVPCGRPAGWGTTHRGVGRCRSHNEQANLRRERLKQQILLQYQQQGHRRRLISIVEEHGLSEATFWRWCRGDPDFYAGFREVIERTDEQRVQIVEETLANRCMQGTASPAEIFFFLVNRSDRWRHINQVVQETEVADVDDLNRQAGREAREVLENELDRLAGANQGAEPTPVGPQDDPDEPQPAHAGNGASGGDGSI